MNRFLLVFLFSLFSSSVFAQAKIADNLLVDASDAVWGDANAPVTIVMYSDLQCPFCQRASLTIAGLERKYSQSVRFVFRHFPLAFHKQAEPAARAAIAAQNQGKFKEMHNLIFKNYKQLKSNGINIDNYLRGLALQLGLDEIKFMKDYQSSITVKKVQKDMKSGQALGVRGTPHFFVNGERITGAQPSSKFESVIDAQIIAAGKLTGNNRYRTLVRRNYKKIKAPVRKKKETKIQYVSIDEGDPIWGSKKALVTIVEFSEYQCPFCDRANPTLKRLKKKYGKKVRIVYKQLPLPFHKQAKQAARAVLAANKQGKFLKMKDLLYKNAKKFKSEDMDALMMKLAKKARLKMGKFETDYYSDDLKNHVQMNLDQAEKVGARGTPNFFVNGIQLVGAKPYPSFVEVIDEQLKVARKIKKREKLSGNKLYRAIVKENEKNKPTTGKIVPEKIDSLKELKKLKRPFWKGKKRAKVVMHIMSDFQCPYCKRAADTINSIYPEYKDRVKFVFVNTYLPFHKEAEIAHLAAIAAGRQGKFWEMHDKIFANKSRKISSRELADFAKDIGLNMKRYRRDIKSSKTKKQLAREMKISKAAGLRGTPRFDVNGEALVGAQPAEKFRELLDRHLNK